MSHYCWYTVFFIFPLPLPKGTFRVGKDIKCLYGAYDCDDCYCRVCFSDCDILRQNGKAEKERFLNTFGTQSLFGLDSADADLSVPSSKGNEYNTRNFVFGNTYITDQNRSFVFRGEQNNDGGDFTLINIAGSGILNVPKPICELLYSFHLLYTFDLTDTKVEQINDDVQGCARIIDSSDGFNYGSFLFFNGKSIVYLNIQYSDSLSLDKDYVTEQCVRYLENTK